MGSKRINPAKYHGQTVSALSMLHTGTLMNIRKATYVGRNCDCCGEAISASDRAYNEAQRQLLNNVLEILKDRPHIPNKMERKAARQASAKGKK